MEMESPAYWRRIRAIGATIFLVGQLILVYALRAERQLPTPLYQHETCAIGAREVPCSEMFGQMESASDREANRERQENGTVIFWGALIWLCGFGTLLYAASNLSRIKNAVLDYQYGKMMEEQRQPFAGTSTPTHKRCGRCGLFNPPDAVHCSSCGYRLPSST